MTAIEKMVKWAIKMQGRKGGSFTNGYNQAMHTVVREARRLAAEESKAHPKAEPEGLREEFERLMKWDDADTWMPGIWKARIKQALSRHPAKPEQEPLEELAKRKGGASIVKELRWPGLSIFFNDGQLRFESEQLARDHLMGLDDKQEEK